MAKYNEAIITSDSPVVSTFLGGSAYYLSRCLQKTLRTTIQAESALPDGACVFCFWHGKQFLPVIALRHPGYPQVALVSPSKDGDILDTCLRMYGFHTIRGSSNQKSVRALAQMVRAVKSGHALGLAPDGPTGPIYHAKPGALFIAHKAQVPIVPVGVSFSRKWIFHKAWDRYEVPKPFSRASLYIGSPLWLPPTEEGQRELEQAIHQADEKAVGVLSGHQVVDYNALSPISLRKKTPSN